MLKRSAVVGVVVMSVIVSLGLSTAGVEARVTRGDMTAEGTKQTKEWIQGLDQKRYYHEVTRVIAGEKVTLKEFDYEEFKGSFDKIVEGFSQNPSAVTSGFVRALLVLRKDGPQIDYEIGGNVSTAFDKLGKIIADNVEGTDNVKTAIKGTADDIVGKLEKSEDVGDDLTTFEELLGIYPGVATKDNLTAIAALSDKYHHTSHMVTKIVDIFEKIALMGNEGVNKILKEEIAKYEKLREAIRSQPKGGSEELKKLLPLSD